MITLPNELLLEVVRCATGVAAELDDRFCVPSQTNMDAMLRASIPTRRALVQVSRRLWNCAIVVTHAGALHLLFQSMEKDLSDLMMYWRMDVPGIENLMRHLANLKRFCAMGWLHPTTHSRTQISYPDLPKRHFLISAHYISCA